MSIEKMERLKRIGKRTIIFENEPKIVLTSSVVGPKEIGRAHV